MTGSQDAPGVMAALTDREKAEILDALITQDTTLAARAGREGRSLLARVEVANVADAVADALLGLDQEELSRHAGRTRYGYVEAAWRRGGVAAARGGASATVSERHEGDVPRPKA